MPKSKKKESQRGAGASKTTKKRLRLPSTSDEDFSLPTTSSARREEEGSSKGASASNPKPSCSQNIKKVKKEERGEEGRVKKKEEKGGGGGEKEKGGPYRQSEIESLATRKWKQKFAKTEAEKKRLIERYNTKKVALAAEREKVTAADKKVAKLRKDLVKTRKNVEKLSKEKDEAVKEVKDEAVRLKKKIDSLKQKAANLELEKAKLESKLASLKINESPEAGSSKGGASCQGSGGLFQDMMDNFRELAETQLQCAVCSEVLVEATSVNCGHTFCHHCITVWRAKKPSCPVCRADIKQLAACKVLDEYTDKLYEQFVSEGGQLARQSVKDERLKLRQEEEAAAAARLQDRRARAERRNEFLIGDGEEEEGDNLEMVDIVLNRSSNDPVSRARRRMEDEESVNSDTTLELHLSDGDLRELSDSDSEVDLVPFLTRSRRLLLDDTDTDSEDDEDFRASDNNRNDTDSLSDSTESSESESSDSSSDTEDSD